MTLNTTPWRIDDHLTTPDAMAGYLDAVFEDGDPALIAAALNDIARARGVAAADPLTNEAMASVVRTMKSLGLELAARARAA